MKALKPTRSKEIFYRVVGSLLLCAALFGATLLMGKLGNEVIDQVSASRYFSASMMCLALYEFSTLLHLRHEEGKLIVFRIFYVLLDVVAAGFAIAGRGADVYFAAAGVVYLITHVLKRVESMVRKHTKRNVTLNVLILLINVLMLFGGLVSFGMEELRAFVSLGLIGIVVLITCLLNVAKIALSNFNMTLLRKIIRKTYAGEILFGLLLLIISFSLALTTLEPTVKNFGDALWYCFAIVTTIGFGDFVASSVLGRILSVVLGIYGIVVVSIITSIIVNFYNEVRATPDEEDAADKEEEAKAKATACDEPIAEQEANETDEADEISQEEETPAEAPEEEN